MTQIYYLYDHMITNILFIRSFLFTSNLQRRRCLYKRKCTKTPPSHIFSFFFFAFSLFFFAFFTLFFCFFTPFFCFFTPFYLLTHINVMYIFIYSSFIIFFKKKINIFFRPQLPSVPTWVFFLRRVVLFPLFFFYKKMNKNINKFFTKPRSSTSQSSSALEEVDLNAPSPNKRKEENSKNIS